MLDWLGNVAAGTQASSRSKGALAFDTTNSGPLQT